MCSSNSLGCARVEEIVARADPSGGNNFCFMSHEVVLGPEATKVHL